MRSHRHRVFLVACATVIACAASAQQPPPGAREGFGAPRALPDSELARLGIVPAELEQCEAIVVPGLGTRLVHRRVVDGVPVRGNALLVSDMDAGGGLAEPTLVGEWLPVPQQAQAVAIDEDAAQASALRALSWPADLAAGISVERWREPDGTPLLRVIIDAPDGVGIAFVNAATGNVIDFTRIDAPWVNPATSRLALADAGAGDGQIGGEAKPDAGPGYIPNFVGAERAFAEKKAAILGSCFAALRLAQPQPDLATRGLPGSALVPDVANRGVLEGTAAPPDIATRGLLQGSALPPVRLDPGLPGQGGDLPSPMLSAGMETFEAVWPDAYWSVYDSNQGSGVSTWGDVSCSSPRGGSWHAWCAATSQPACSTHPNDMFSSMWLEATYGGTTSSGTNRLHLWLKQQVETGFDKFRVYVDGFASQPPRGGGVPDTSWHWEWGTNIPAYTWYHIALPADFDPLFYLRIQFVFISDSSVVNAGTFVDDICFNGNCESGLPANTIYPYVPCTLGSFNQLSPGYSASLSCPGSIFLDWSTSSGASSYDVFIDGNFAQNVTTSSWSTTMTSGQHSWDVRAVCADGTTRWSENGPFPITVANAPGAFNQVTPAQGSSTCSTSVAFLWGSAPGATSYTLYLDGNVLTTTTVNNYQATVPAGSHTWDVIATCSGQGTWSTNGPFSLTVGAAPAVFDLTSPSDGTSSCTLPALLDWADAAGATAYDVIVGGVIRATTSASQWVPTGLGTGTHSWRVTARNTCGSRQSTSTRQFTLVTGTAPGAPSSPVPAHGATLSSCLGLLDWADASGATSYDLRVDGVLQATGLTSSQHVVSPTLATGMHTWQVTARNACSQTVGPTWSFTCSPSPPMTLSVPTGAEVEQGELVQVPVNLSAGSGVSGAQFMLSLTPSACLRIVGIAAGSRLSPSASFTITTNPAVISEASPADGPVSVLIDSTGTAMPSADGALLLVSLLAQESCAADTVVAVTPSAATLTRNLQSESALTVAGSVTVIETPPPGCRGDLDASNSRDSTDVVLLRRAIVGLTPPSPVPDNADYDGNGFVDSTDVVLLRRCITGLQACIDTCQ